MWAAQEFYRFSGRNKFLERLMDDIPVNLAVEAGKPWAI